MSRSLIDNYSKEALEEIVQQSYCYRDVLKKIGYYTVTGNANDALKKKIAQYNIDISHFTYQKGIVRTQENVFCNNSTATQAVLRRWYRKGAYSEYICSICGQIPEWQGKELTLILDHIDGNHTNNVLTNLRWVCPNCNQQLETTGFKKMRTKTADKKKTIYYCIDCGKQVSKQGNRCLSCAGKQNQLLSTKQQAQATNTINRDILKQLIRSESFVAIGKQFGVTDNAIRKWCKTYNLPSKKSDIKSYSDEEWELI